MRAGFEFLGRMQRLPDDDKRKAHRIEVHLFGSLAATGRGHGTDKAVLGGLLGTEPMTCKPGCLDDLLSDPAHTYHVALNPGEALLGAEDIFFDVARIDLPHSNTMMIRLLSRDNAVLCEQEYFSVGGGFIEWPGMEPSARANPVHCYSTMNELKQLINTENLRLAELMLDNERAITGCSEEEIFSRMDHQFAIMEQAVTHGLAVEGVLPGPMRYCRKAPGIHRRARRLAGRHDQFMLELCAYAFAVAEENAAGQPIVTTPTCGSAGVVAAIWYFMKHHMKKDHATLQDAYLAAAVIGFLAKQNASISGAEVGCQGEIGVAASMAAAMLAYADTSDLRIVENAAQIALEHHLGMTCDPIAGYVQIPCIERNAMGAVKAYTAYLIATTEISRFHRLNLDGTLHTMLITGRDLQSKYRETAQGGLASFSTFNIVAGEHAVDASGPCA
jgi:L-serine dehydratase